MPDEASYHLVSIGLRDNHAVSWAEEVSIRSQTQLVISFSIDLFHRHSMNLVIYIVIIHDKRSVARQALLRFLGLFASFGPHSKLLATNLANIPSWGASSYYPAKHRVIYIIPSVHSSLISSLPLSSSYSTHN